ncbi:hypothetical protein ACFWP2_26845 [Kitasatospora sp. NPDC058444]|uniref:hypothetical protein n=1 Tax=Kitasatospora sp. NPDC058444 TaxID=3346504 RepID=UPI003663D5E1
MVEAPRGPDVIGRHQLIVLRGNSYAVKGRHPSPHQPVRARPRPTPPSDCPCGSSGCGSDPGEGYIAPTELLPHDSSTEDQPQPSTVAFRLGHWPRGVLASLIWARPV